MLRPLAKAFNYRRIVHGQALSLCDTVTMSGGPRAARGNPRPELARYAPLASLLAVMAKTFSPSKDMPTPAPQMEPSCAQVGHHGWRCAESLTELMKSIPTLTNPGAVRQGLIGRRMRSLREDMYMSRRRAEGCRHVQ